MGLTLNQASAAKASQKLGWERRKSPFELGGAQISMGLPLDQASAARKVIGSPGGPRRRPGTEPVVERVCCRCWWRLRGWMLGRKSCGPVSWGPVSRAGRTAPTVISEWCVHGETGVCGLCRHPSWACWELVVPTPEGARGHSIRDGGELSGPPGEFLGREWQGALPSVRRHW